MSSLQESIETSAAALMGIQHFLRAGKTILSVKLSETEVLRGGVAGSGGAVLPVCVPWCGRALQSEPHL